MSKAEERALETYPPKYAKQERHPQRMQSEKVDTHQSMRTIYIEGYRQAEKDLALTWEDVREICTQSVLVEIDLGRLVSDERHYTEVLNRFNKQKEDGKVQNRT